MKTSVMRMTSGKHAPFSVSKKRSAEAITSYKEDPSSSRAKRPRTPDNEMTATGEKPHEGWRLQAIKNYACEKWGIDDSHIQKHKGRKKSWLDLIAQKDKQSLHDGTKDQHMVGDDSGGAKLFNGAAVDYHQQPNETSSQSHPQSSNENQTGIFHSGGGGGCSSGGGVGGGGGIASSGDGSGDGFDGSGGSGSGDDSSGGNAVIGGSAGDIVNCGSAGSGSSGSAGSGSSGGGSAGEGKAPAATTGTIAFDRRFSRHTAYFAKVSPHSDVDELYNQCLSRYLVGDHSSSSQQRSSTPVGKRAAGTDKNGRRASLLVADVPPC